jgi:ribose 5-phosphate isomerase B
MKIAIGSDHAGYLYKEAVKALLHSLGHVVRDFGTPSVEPAVDYPVFIRPVAEAVARGEFERGIVFGGSGNGEAIVANKVRGIRCALCWSEQTAQWAREHNDANVLSIGERTVSQEMALTIVRLWLETPFAGGRHARRIAQIEQALQ